MGKRPTNKTDIRIPCDWRKDSFGSPTDFDPVLVFGLELATGVEMPPVDEAIGEAVPEAVPLAAADTKGLVELPPVP